MALCKFSLKQLQRDKYNYIIAAGFIDFSPHIICFNIIRDKNFVLSLFKFLLITDRCFFIAQIVAAFTIAKFGEIHVFVLLVLVLLG